MEKPKPYLNEILGEIHQAHPTRKKLFEDIENIIKTPLISYFTSFSYQNVMMEDPDANMIEGFLQSMDLSRGLCLIINSPGGLGLTAERIINMCRKYSGTNEYSVIVPNKAKSAATMVCFGANKIYMGPTSELGPVDPQVALVGNNGVDRFSVHDIVNRYEYLFDEAVKTQGRLEPFIQQLNHYDDREITKYKNYVKLSEDISIRALKTGMMKDIDKNGHKTEEDAIKEKIQIFLKPEHTKSHGRPIYCEEAKSCGLNIEYIDKDKELWNIIYRLFVRSDRLVSTSLQKCIETASESFSASAQV